jgi:hypothetical protein
MFLHAHASITVVAGCNKSITSAFGSNDNSSSNSKSVSLYERGDHCMHGLLQGHHYSVIKTVERSNVSKVITI